MAIKKLKFALNPLTANLDLTNDVSDMVDGPASATDNAIVRYDGTTGKLVQDSAVSIDDSGNIATSAQITVGTDAVSALQVVTKQQLDAAIGGVDVKQSVIAATTADITLSGEQTIDTVAVVTGDRVLVKNQSTPAQNGIYIVDSGAWTRSTDADTFAELIGALVTVQSGGQQNTGWYQTTDSGTIGVTSVVWQQFFGAGTYAADGQGIELTGSTFSLELDGTTLSKSASGVRVASGGITNTEINAAAAIAYSKLNLNSSIVDADVATSAAIARSKLAAGTANRVAVNNGSGVLSDAAAITAARALISDANGIPTHSTVTDTELAYLSGTTSSVQTQLDGKQPLLQTLAINSDVTLTANRVHLVDTSAARALTLPAAAADLVLQVKDATGQAESNTITITPASGTIDGQASLTITSNYASIYLISNGTNWFVC